MTESSLMLIKIISGGQTGADQAALRAAKNYGIPTGGFIPKGWLTELGPMPELAKYNLVETVSDKYSPRTYSNVYTSDGTLCFASNFGSAGERCTLKAIQMYSKPYLDIDVRRPKAIQEVFVWISKNKISVLNVAGNRESTYPGIGDFVESYLTKLFLLTNPIS